MGAAAVSENADIKFKINKELIIFVAGILLVLLILSRYIVNGEPVDIRSDKTEISIELSLYDGMEIRQPVTVTEEMNWRQGYYALYFAQCDTDSDGQLIITVEQGKTLQTVTIALSDIRSGEWIRLDDMNLGNIECVDTVLRLHTAGVSQGELAIAAGQDYYGFGVVDYNGVRQELTLAQAYHYHLKGTEYKIRLLCYGIVMLCMALLFAVVSRQRIESKRQCFAVFGILTLMFMAMIYLLDSSIYLEPTYAEAVTNFLKFAREEKFTDNLFITDAGYLPLLPRVITLLYVKVLRIPSSYVLYFMQFTACLICSMIWAFFVLYPFRGIMKLPNRILWCILVMLTCFCEETLFFTNHAYWGIYFLLLMMIADLKEFHGLSYICLTAFGALVCLSKGTYAVILPLAVLCMVFMYRGMTVRDRVFICVAGTASLLQVLYAFGGQGDGSSWIAAASGGMVDYLLRMIVSVFVGIQRIFAIALWKICGASSHSGSCIDDCCSCNSGGRLCKKSIVTLHTEEVSRQRAEKFLYHRVVPTDRIGFFLVTVKPVPDSWRSIGHTLFGQMGHKYEIFSDIGFYMLLLTGSVMVRQKAGHVATTEASDSKRLHSVIEVCGRYGILALMGVFCLTNPVMKLTGWADAETSDGRVYAGNINTGWLNCKDWMQNSAFFIPIRGDYWSYSRNSTIYQVGTDVYFEESSCVNLEEEISGYHSSYEVQDEMQAQNLIGVMIRRPERIKSADCKVQLLDAEHNVIAETGQAGDGRYKKSFFRFDEPVNGVKSMQFVDANGEQVYYKDYIAWVCAW